MRILGWGFVLAALICGPSARAENDVEDLRKEIDELRRMVKKDDTAPTIQAVDALADTTNDKANQEIKTNTGKLEIGGLLQIWEQHIFKDDERRDVFGDLGSRLQDNNTTRIRRAELKFTMNLTENITAVTMIDPAREALSFSGVPSNFGLFKSQPSFSQTTFGAANPTTVADAVRNGRGSPNMILQDAYINIHDLIPHHDITIGQFKPPAGEEGPRSSANLDFIERAMVDQLNDYRDLGFQVHGTYWPDCETKIGRLQYWAGVFDGAGNYFSTAGQFQNRADDNNSKDLAGKIMVRPIWSDCLYGRVEVGAWGEYGDHGENGNGSPDGSAPTNSLEHAKTHAYRLGAWALWKPMGCLRGGWLRGEYGAVRDRTAPFTVDAFGLGSGPNGEQANPNPFRREGYYVAAGYKLTDSIFADELKKGGFFRNLIQPVEFVGRFERFQNILVEDIAVPDQLTDKYATRVITAGVNYYIWQYKHRIQVNFSNVRESINPVRYPGMKEVGNNQFIMSYQIQF